MAVPLPCFFWVENYAPPFSSQRYLPPLPRAAAQVHPHPPPSPLPSHLQLFTLIGLKTNGPLAVSKETVTLAHFLDVADAIVKNVDAIKTLDAQAQVWGVGGVITPPALPLHLVSPILPPPPPCLQGESMMRKALAELKLWGLQREFELSETSSQVQREWVACVCVCVCGGAVCGGMVLIPSDCLCICRAADHGLKLSY